MALNYTDVVVHSDTPLSPDIALDYRRSCTDSEIPLHEACYGSELQM